MSNKPFRDILGGITLGLLIFLVLSTSAVLVIGTAAAQQAPLFSVTMIASTGNPVRRQYATIIASGMQSEISCVYVGPESDRAGAELLARLARARGGQFVIADRAQELALRVEQFMLPGA